MALRRLASAFAAAGVAEPEADARILIEEATGASRTALLLDGDRPLGPEAAARLDTWTTRRLAREPVFRIVGRRDFWGLTLRVTPAVLDPRPDTEAVVEAALRFWSDSRGSPRRLLDLGTGSGALLCALLDEWPGAVGIGVDRSEAACAVARDNLAACGLAERGHVLAGDWTAPVEGRFDLVVCNPPYIASAAIAGLDAEVREHDPVVALDGGDDGFAAYRILFPLLPAVLAPGGLAVLEVGVTQADAVRDMLVAAGLTALGTQRDLGGVERAVVATLSDGPDRR